MKLKVRRTDYNIRCTGCGEPLVLLHGFTGSGSSWDPILADLVKSFRVIQIDLLGHGQTECADLPERCTMENQVDDLIAVFDYFHFTQVNVLGYSMGGRVALSLACLHPERIRRLILESATPGLESETARNARRKHDRQLAAFISSEGIDHFVDYWENIPLFETQKALPKSQREQIRRERLNNRPQKLSGSLIGMGTGAQPSWWGEIAQLDLPILLITGSRDQKFCAIARRMKQLMRHCDWRVVFGCGHNIHLEDLRKFTDCVLTFFRQQEG